jgi:SAM-dependent methyltransferase
MDYLEAEVEALESIGYNVVHGDAQDFDLGQEFDTVVAGELIEHLSDTGSFLDSVRRHLAPDATFMLTTPNPWIFQRFRQALLTKEVHSNEEHTCWFDEWTLQQVLRRHGFETDEVRYVRPPIWGISQTLYDLGQTPVGGSHLLVIASPEE